jgi:predicted extracellular nuclease
MSSPLVGSNVRIIGIITAVNPGTGFYLEEPDSDDSSNTSNGIYVDNAALSLQVRPGEQWMLAGRVVETGPTSDTVTTLSAVSDHQLCASGLEVPQNFQSLPLDEGQREALESMQVSISGPLFITGVYGFSRGQVLLSGGSVLRNGTEDTPPGEAARAVNQRNDEHSIRSSLGVSNGGLLHNGLSIESATGVFGHDERGSLWLLDQVPVVQAKLPDRLPLADPELTRVVSMNLLNFFNGDGSGQGFPAERGAKTHEDFVKQSHRIQSAVSALQPGLIAVQELENDGFEPGSASDSLRELCSSATSAEWALVKSPHKRLGTDVISVGLFYRPDLLKAVGPAHTLDSAPFRDLSRQPLAQLFQERSSGLVFLVAVNHLKSKGSCPAEGENANQYDGQGCWNPARRQAAEALIDWLNGIARAAPTENILVLGDFNAYRREDPVQVFQPPGWSEAVAHASGLPQHSYVYAGQAGTLDYAFVSRALLPFLKQANIWHVNADWPPRVEMPLPWMRFSDHDPVVVDLDFNQSATPD